MTPERTAAAVATLTARLDSAWSTDPGTLRRARSLEISGWAFYLAGRAGVLGDDADPRTVAAVLGVIAPDAVLAGWDSARRVGPAVVAAARLAECARWGEQRLTPVADARLVELLDRVVTAADPAGMPLFAAARRAAQGCGDGPGARTAVLTHLLAEHRAAALLITTRACGMRPVEAVLAAPEGEQEAITFGWNPPFPPRLSLLRRYAYATALADRLAGAAYGVLSRAERAELVEALTKAAAAADG